MIGVYKSQFDNRKEEIMSNVTIILTSDYNLKASRCIVSVPDECYIINENNKVQYIALKEDINCIDGVGYKVVEQVDDYYKYKESSNSDLIADIKNGKYKVVCADTKLGGEKWEFSSLPLSRVFYYKDNGLSEKEVMKVKFDIIDTIYMKILEDNSFGDINNSDSLNILLDIVKNARNEVKESKKDNIKLTNPSINNDQELTQKSWWQFWK